MTKPELNKLVEAFNNNPAVEASIKYYATRKRARQNPNINRESRIIASKSPQISPKEVGGSYRLFEETGVGRIIPGHNGEPNRFHFEVNPIDVAKQVLGHEQEIRHIRHRDKPMPRVYFAESERYPDKPKKEQLVEIRIGDVIIKGPKDQVLEIVKNL